MSLSLPMCLSCIATALATLVGVFYLYAKYKLSYWSRKGVKSPPAHIVFGNMKDSILFKNTPGQVLRDIYYSVDTDEPYVGCYLFHKPLLILRSIELVKQVMIKDFEVFPNRGFGGDTEADTLGYINLLGIRQPRWKYLRSKLTPCLTGQKLRNMLPLVVECSKNLMEYIESEKPDDQGSKCFELKETAGKYCTDVFASVAFGVTTNCFDVNNTEFWEAGKRVLHGLKRGIILIIHFFLPELIRLTALVSRGPAKFFRDIFWHSYTTRERVGNKRGDLVDSLMALKNGEQNPDFVFEDDNLVAQAVSFYVAGFEATSTAIAFALYDLSRSPEHEENVYKEIMRIGHTDELTMDKLSEMTLLEKCINESLRLHPPLPMNDRVCVRDYKGCWITCCLNGIKDIKQDIYQVWTPCPISSNDIFYTGFPGNQAFMNIRVQVALQVVQGTDVILEKGTTVYVATCGTNSDPRFFKDPEKYDPTRTDSENLGFSAAHLSFGIGPRSCIGQRFGLVIVKVALVMILRKYTLTCKTTDHELKAGTVFTTAVHGVPLRMQRRH